MLDYTALATLSTLLRLGSFDAAAAALGVTPSAISQRIRALEDRLGTVLVVRGQPCTATPTATRLIRHTEAVQLLEQEALADLIPSAAVARPVIRVAVTADSLATWVIPALARVPGVSFDLVIDDQDHSADWLRRGEVTAAVTGHAAPVQGCDCHALGAMRYLAVAAPGFIAAWFGTGVTPETLARAPAITFNAKDRLQADWVRGVVGRRLPYPSHWIASSHGFVDAALAGMGWGMNPEALIRTALADGRLVPLLPDRPLDVALYWQVSRLAAPGLAPLSRAIRAASASAMRREG